ncbi:MAG: M48 family metalloprotease [Armatimonadota bacterium]
MFKFFGSVSVFTFVVVSNAQFKPSKADQIKAGKEYAIKIRKENKVLPDTDPRVRLLRLVGQRYLNARTPEEIKKEPWEFTFDVIDSKEVNAFAIPGGPVFFFTGLIDKLTTVDEIAGIMGHELTHVRREHWASAVNAQQTRSLGIIALGTIFGVGKKGMDLAQIVNEIGFNLEASRGQEKEADQYGFDFDLKAGYNPEGMISVFELFRKLKGGGGNVEFLSTHPDDKNRINALTKKIDDYKKKGLIVKLPPLTPLPFETTATKAAKQPIIKSSAPVKGLGGTKE